MHPEFANLYDGHCGSPIAGHGNDTLASSEATPNHDSPPQVRKQAATLLGLPRELRDRIYTYAIRSDYERSAPTDPDHAGDRHPRADRQPGAIYFEARSPAPPILQLAASCRTLRAEAHDALSAARRRAAVAVVVDDDDDDNDANNNQPDIPSWDTSLDDDDGGGDNSAHNNQADIPTWDTSLHLDVMVRGSAIWPTWTNVQAPTYRLRGRMLDVQLRIFDEESSGDGGSSSNGSPVSAPTSPVASSPATSPEFRTGAYRALWALMHQLTLSGASLGRNGGGPALAEPLSFDIVFFEVRFCHGYAADANQGFWDRSDVVDEHSVIKQLDPLVRELLRRGFVKRRVVVKASNQIKEWIGRRQR